VALGAAAPGDAVLSGRGRTAAAGPVRLALLLALLAAAAGAWASPAQAQAPALPSLPKAADGGGAAAADPAADRARLEELARTLEDEQARARLVEQIKALSAVQAAAAEDEGWLARSLGQLRRATARRVEAAGASLVELAASLRAVPELARWLGGQLSDPVNRSIWWTVLSQIGLAAALGVLASLAVRALLGGWRDRRTAALPPAAPVRAKLAAGGARLLVDVVGLLVFVAVTHAALQLLQVTYLAKLVAVDLLRGAALARGLTAASRALLSADRPRARVPALTDGQAEAARRWFSTVSGLAIYGHFGLAAALRLGLPWGAHGFLRHLLFAVVTALVVVGIFRVRGQVAGIIRGLGEARGSTWLHPLVPWRALATAGPYVLAAWVILQYAVWALRIPEGTVLLTRGALGTILALALLRALRVSLDRLGRPPAPAAALQADGQPPPEEAAAEPAPTPAWRTAALAALRVGGVLLAAAVVLQAWGFRVDEWLLSRTGRDILARIASVLVVAGVAFLLWYGVDRAAHRYISAQDPEGNPVHNNRTRTLANIVRNLALVVALFVVVGNLLTELGVNTAALLAGAGVVGFAIGFGSQKLVQDLTTGLFILLGDTVRVGDVVQVGGLGGVVEAVSMRTVTLRDYNGNVHTIPYSSISIVTNMTKDYAYAVFNVSVGYGEDVDRVIDVLREIDSQMRREWPYRRLMPEPLDVAGVDAFTERGVTIVARSRTRAGEQWKVQREFNRRLKKRFDELGIAFPVPQQLVHIADPSQQQREQPPQPRRGGGAAQHPRPEMVVRAAEGRGGA
jgi:moderate conductance mechanosensitive channel